MGTRWIKPDSGLWMVDGEGNWVRSNVPVVSDEDGWLYTTRRAKAGLRDPGSGPYVAAHPTNFNWRSDVRDLVDKYEEEFYSEIFINTYWNHPPIRENWDNRYDPLSFDVWHSDGRGRDLNRIGYNRATEVFNRIFNDPAQPSINWIIWRGWMWTSAGGWQVWDPAEDGSDPGHHRHIHVTYW